MFGEDWWRDDDFNEVSDLAYDAMERLGKVIQTKFEQPQARLVGSHLAHAMKRVRDVQRILRRIASLRRKLIDLDLKIEQIMPKNWPPGVPFPDDVQLLNSHRMEVSDYLEMDFEALYIYGGILLDQLAAVAGYFGGYDRTVWFARLIQDFSKEEGHADFPVNIRTLWEKHRASLLRHYVAFKVFRDKFIVHHDMPWQRGTSRDMLTGDYRLSNLMSVGWLAPEVQEEAVREIISILDEAPVWLKRAHEAHKMRVMQLLERYLAHVEEFDELTRKRIQLAALKFGFTSPSYHDVGANLLELAKVLAETLSQEI